jgi:predicted NAD/FAD-binding protein
MKIAIVGSGISGLAAAHALRDRAQVTLFEANSYFGGHAHTVDVTLPGRPAPGAPLQPITSGVDTGFLVFNERTYPRLIQLFETLGVATARSDMSFSVRTALSCGRSLEWNGASLNTVFAQRRNVLNWRFVRMLGEVLRFNQLTTELAQQGQEQAINMPLGDFLQTHRFGSSFQEWYFLPMLGCIWSCPTRQMLRFPVSTMIRFCHNHGLIQVNRRPQWWTVQGGSRQYVQMIVPELTDRRLNTAVRQIARDALGVTVCTDQGRERFDKVVLATHSDQALALLQRPSPQEIQTLGAITYHANRAVLHTDCSVLPQQRRAWAAWNYERAERSDQESSGVCLHYLLNKLQPLPFEQPVIETLNPVRPIDPDHVLGTFDYAHPVFDLAALRAQREMPTLQGQQHTYFCGAWMGYGFHEDGLKAGLEVARLIQFLPEPAALCPANFEALAQ